MPNRDARRSREIQVQRWTTGHDIKKVDKKPETEKSTDKAPAGDNPPARKRGSAV